MSELQDLLEEIGRTDVRELLRSIAAVPFPPPPPDHPDDWPPEPTSRDLLAAMPDVELAKVVVSARSLLARHRRKLRPEIVADLQEGADAAERELERRQLRVLPRSAGFAHGGHRMRPSLLLRPLKGD